MARKPRLFVDSEVYHIILRGNDCQNIFYDDSDREFFIQRMYKYSAETGIELYAYCLMDNHVHLLMGKANKNMALFVKKLACSYVYRFNKKYKRSGHLFQGRYKSEPVETGRYFKTVYRYILKNPEKAQICNFQNYKWSSFQNEEENEFIKSSFINAEFGSEEAKKSFLQIKDDDLCMENISELQSRLYDDELKINFIKQLFKIENVLTISKETAASKIDKLCVLKKLGFPINQIARITGINRYYIYQA